jgi:hypothetical protein
LSQPLFIFRNRYITAFLISFGSHGLFVMMVFGSAFGINADAAKTFPEICGEKQAKI